MLRNVSFLARMDLRYSLRQRETLVWAFVMPIVFFYFIGTVTGGFGGGGSSGTDRIRLEEGAAGGFLVDELAAHLGEMDYEVERASEAGAEGESRARVVVPDDFTDRVLRGEETAVELHPGGSSLMGDYHEFRVGRAVYTLLASLVASAEAGEEPSAAGFERLRGMPRALTLSVEPAGERERIPVGFEQTIPGTTVMFTLILLMTSGAVLIVIERQQGLLRRLASTPIGRGEVVAGKWAGLLALGLIQLAFAMLAGTLLFDMHWGPDLPMVCLVLATWAALVASMTLVLGCLARTEGQAVGIGVLSANVLAALGGCWWPIEVAPDWMQTLQLFLPTGWAMDAMHQLAIFHNGATSALPHALGMALAAVACGWVGAKLFRYQ
jgi:ABC-type Na+ efflux pump permease subunit